MKRLSGEVSMNTNVQELDPTTNLDLSGDQLREMLYKMHLIRAFEEAAFEQYAAGKVHGTMHLAIGQEATGVGSIAALRPDDQIASTHRGHAHGTCHAQLGTLPQDGREGPARDEADERVYRGGQGVGEGHQHNGGRGAGDQKGRDDEDLEAGRRPTEAPQGKTGDPRALPRDTVVEPSGDARADLLTIVSGGRASLAALGASRSLLLGPTVA